ncbi:putative disease resistance RPP13-like protein 3 [Phoenix dactylifera]|uniref:Disease resistance RPP13-like protein 3 n=1 Tax=Phoenix dactylifera TaxID=42345 RepID=A0A8B8ZGF0_PHODC|nr:putative disease resistance RPP13-like protein 3 [Phoenix dactylifera]
MPVSLVSNVVSQLTNLLVQEAAFLRGVNNQIKCVETELRLLQDFLKDADAGRKRGDERMESWIREIREVAYEVEDIIDRVKFMAERQRQRGFMDTISRQIDWVKTQLQQLQGFLKDADSKKEERRCNNGELDYADERSKSSAVDESWQSLRESSPHSDDDDTDVVGFENDKKKLVSRLLDENEKARRVISIVVSQSYRGIELVKDIMKKVMGIKQRKGDLAQQMGEEDVRQMLRDFLRDKMRVFPDENRGSRILLTTRNIEVAKDAEPWIPPHELHLLDDTESWKLFRRKALPPNQDVPAELEALAQKLAKKCGGLPLALVVLGGLLSRKDPSYDTWLKVAQSMNWVVGGEGFILQEQRQTMEGTARDWLDELVQRCMIQVVERSMSRGLVKSICIHDLLRDFGLKMPKKDEFLHVCSSEDVGVSDRISSHRAAFYNRINDEPAVFSRHLRTLLGFSLSLTSGGRF